MTSVLGPVALLAGCTTVDVRHDAPAINAMLAARGAPALAWDGNAGAAADVAGWRGEPMTAERAVRIAMVRSPRLQEQYARLGLARADIMEAVQIANPSFRFSRLGTEGAPGTQFGLAIVLPIVDLIVLPARARLARADYERARLAIAAAVLDVGFDVEAAWFDYVGAQQVAEMRAAVARGFATSAALAGRFHAAGNISELQLKREEAAASDARIAAARALVAARLKRLALNAVIGLGGADADWPASDRLPLPPAQEDDPATLLNLGNDGNLALLAQRREVAILRNVAGITRRSRLFNGFEAGLERERQTDGSTILGPTGSIELPIFNQGGARVERSQARLRDAEARVKTLELRIDNEVRLGAERVRVLADIVRTHREALLPARATVVARAQQEQNFMLIGVFELIMAKTQQYDAWQGYLEAIRDYWLARVDLMRIVGARLPSEAQATIPAPAVEEILAPPAAAMDHGSHASHGAAAPAPAMDHDGHAGHGASAPTPPAPAVDNGSHAGHADHGAPGAAPPRNPAPPTAEPAVPAAPPPHAAHMHEDTPR